MSGAPQTPSLRALAEDAREAGRLALDTEFMGEGRYRTLLCLVQLATPERGDAGERIMLVDPLEEDLDSSPLAALLADPAVQKVVHAGRQDIALVRRRFDTEVRNVFDTQVAAGFAGMGAQCSYDTLLAELLGLRVAKTASFTRWDSRPLSPEQLAYAREDVVHLLELAAALTRRLSELERLEWAREECEPLERSSDERDLESILARLPRIHTLSASSRPIARELVRWREQTAARHNRPVQTVLGDAALIELAKRTPASRSELAKIRGIGGSSGRRAEELLETVARGRESPPEQPPPRERTPPAKPDDAPLVALAEALLRARAREAGLAYELLATRAELHAIVAAARGAGEADVRTLRGWRRKLAGEELLELLDGRLALSVLGGARGRRVQVERRASAD
ncbi:MAG: ribonuclease [Solirubrobacteraceae bacterium]|jgi:ribonuclease D|nr:ribonuclease [Solirubrobacteraceae bacterium]